MYRSNDSTVPSPLTSVRVRVRARVRVRVRMCACVHHAATHPNHDLIYFDHCRDTTTTTPPTDRPITTDITTTSISPIMCVRADIIDEAIAIDGQYATTDDQHRPSPTIDDNIADVSVITATVITFQID